MVDNNKMVLGDLGVSELLFRNKISSISATSGLMK